MKYFLRDPENQAITGPFEFDEIEARLKAGELPAGTLATADLGEGLARIRHAPPEDWLPIESIRGLGEERQPSAEALPPGPPPAPPQSLMNAPSSTSSGMAFCPACGHKLAPDAGSVCDHCGKELVVVSLVPAQAPESKPDALPPNDSGGAVDGCLAVLGVIVMVIGIIFLIGFLLLLNFMSKCKA